MNDGIEISKKSLKRFLKKLGYSYKRARASITKQDKEIIEEAKKEIEDLKDKVAKDDNMNLYYFDESSFSLNPNIPYGWSPKNEKIMFEATHSKSLKVLGFLGLDNQLKAYTTTDTINSDFLITIFDDFIKELPKNSKTIVILDNAPTHTSNLFQNKIKEWEEQGLFLYFLPTFISLN